MHLVHVECLENLPVDEVSLVVSDMMRAVLVIVVFVQVYHRGPRENSLQQGRKAGLSRAAGSTREQCSGLQKLYILYFVYLSPIVSMVI